MSIREQIEKLEQHEDFTFANTVEYIVSSLEQGYATDCIFYKGNELRVWAEEGKLVSRAWELDILKLAGQEV